MARDTTIPEAEKRLAAARAELERTTAAHEREVARLNHTKDEVEKLTETVRAADPDSEATFAKLVSARDAARGRAEALEARAEKALALVEEARARVAGGERALERARMDELDARRLELEQAMAADVARFRGELVARVAEVLRCVEEANAIERRLGIERNPILYYHNSVWARAPQSNAVLGFAENMLPGEAGWAGAGVAGRS